MSAKRITGISIGLVWSLMATGGHRHGNGGDHVRASFMKLGEAAMTYLEETEEGLALIRTHNLNLTQLRELNTIDVISVSDGILIDNNGSKVEAIGEPGRIILSGDAWMEHFEKERDVYYLVLHELLRAASINDDDYIISGAINPFPVSRKVRTRLTSVYPLLGDESLEDIVDPSQIGLAGTGCPRAQEGTLFEFDTERNVLDISFRKYALLSAGSQAINRKACAIVIPVSSRPGKRIVITQIDLTGKLQMPAGASENASARLSLEAFLPGSSAPIASRRILSNGELQMGRILVRKTEAVRSPCGESTLLRVNTSAHLINSAEVPAVLDTDRLTISLGIEDCQAAPIFSQRR
jgi:hypothetical protein